MTVYAFSRIPAFNPNTNPASVAKSATGSVYDLGDTGFLTPLNLTLVATNTVTTTLISDANGMFPDFTLVDRTQCAFKSGTQVFVLTTTTPIAGPTGPTSTVPGPPGPATTDASLLAAGTVADARLPTRLQDTALNSIYAPVGEPVAQTKIGQRSFIFHDPITKANGPINAGDVLDSGQLVVNNVGATPLSYSGGQMIHAQGSTIGVATAGYLQTQVTSDRVRRMFAKVAWPANALGSAAFVVPSAQWNQSSGILPVAGLHSTHYGNGIWTCGVWNPSAGQSGHVEAHRLDINSGTAVTLQVTTTTPSSTQTTASLTISSMTAASLKTALEGLSNVGAGKTTVVGPFAGKYGIVWNSSLGAVTVAVSASSGTPAPTITAYQGTGGTSGGVTTYASNTTNGRYATVWDGTLKQLDVWLFPETAQGIIFFPDGTNSGYFTDPGINLWTSTYAVHELFENNTSAIDVPASYGKISVDNFYARTDTPTLTKPDLVTQVTALAPQTLCDSNNTTGTDISVGGSVPPGTKYIEIVAIGGGAGGGSGCCTTSGTAGNGGGAGGSAGIIREIIPASALGATWAGVIGHKGAGGASVSSTANGNAGTAGTLSKFTTSAASGAVLAAHQALAGAGGGGGSTGATVGAAGGAGGPFTTPGSASGANGALGSNGGGITTNLGVPGSGGGGGVTTVPVATNGGTGGSNLVRGYTGGTAGVVGGAAPGVGIDISAITITTSVAGVPGPGVGGGAGSITGAAQAGAIPLMYGVGGGGGGASLNGSASGAGGDGIGGYLLVRAHFL